MEKSMRCLAARWKNLCAVWRPDGKIYAPFGGQMEKARRRLADRWEKSRRRGTDGKIYVPFGG
jgi:hypothetical protein